MISHGNQDQGGGGRGYQYQAVKPQDPNALFYNRQAEEVASYKECLKNHAASIGGNSLDGCGEFMSSIDSLNCSVCGCHRNFHRKEVEGQSSRQQSPHYNAVKKAGKSGHQMSVPVMGGGASTQSESIEHGDGDGFFVRKKRFRTKFSQEQKEKLIGFAEKAGWKMQKLDESVVQQFCQEIGIKRKVLKVWMHNNKLNYVHRNLEL